MDARPWIALNCVPGVGNVLFRRLVLRFGSPEAVFKAPDAELLRVEGNRPPVVKSIKESACWQEADEEARKVAGSGVEIVTFTDVRYPSNLKEIHDPPPYLYVKGSLAPEDKVAVAMVGSRMATQYGRQMTRKMSRELASKGITVVSGGARGIDTEEIGRAHV